MRRGGPGTLPTTLVYLLGKKTFRSGEEDFIIGRKFEKSRGGYVWEGNWILPAGGGGGLYVLRGYLIAEGGGGGQKAARV